MTRRLCLFIVFLGMLLAVSGCTPMDFLGTGRFPSDSPSIILPDRDVNSLSPDVAVFYTEHEPGYTDSEVVLRSRHEAMDRAIGFWYQIDPETFGIRTAAGHPSTTIDASVALADSYGLTTEALIYNFLYPDSGMPARVLNTLIDDMAARDRFIAALTELVTTKGYERISLDFEHLPPYQRHGFSELVEHIAQAMHALKVEVSISVAAKTWDDPNQGWAGGYDYARLGAAVDRFIIMAYDEHGFSSGPGPIASIPWVEAVVKYASSQVDTNKIWLGIAGYGFDWTDGRGQPRYMSFEQIESLRQRLGASRRWDDTAHVPYFTYTDAHGALHQVWYENADSTSWKLQLVDEYNLGGIALWRLGLEDPALWPLIQSTFGR